ncbi:MAG TPA: archaellin/type IV pilin N-terminal domain-containing protein [Candidatus Nanoarchaeia archaeon]|nr:archaellin/type IV pilin N-terminal domain-containing protein [Candidatus Nanoarchaeia archaeon]
MNSKGISPLIATVLIVGFTVALAAVIFTWGVNFTKETTEKTTQQANVAQKCGQISFDVDVSCANNAVEYVEVTNREDVQLSAFKLRVINDQVTEVYDINATTDMLKPFGTKRYSGDFSAVQSPSKVELIAGIRVDDDLVYCSQYVREAKVECQ